MDCSTENGRPFRARPVSCQNCSELVVVNVLQFSVFNFSRVPLADWSSFCTDSCRAGTKPTWSTRRQKGQYQNLQILHLLISQRGNHNRWAPGVFFLWVVCLIIVLFESATVATDAMLNRHIPLLSASFTTAINHPGFLLSPLLHHINISPSPPLSINLHQRLPDISTIFSLTM